MVHGFRRMMFAFCTALMLSVLSVVSAHHMAPDRDDAARVEAFHAMGMLAEYLCGLGESAHDHRCPFCHKLPVAPRITAPDQPQRIVQVVVQNSSHDLVLGPQLLSAHVSVRAPPRAV
ncbi:MAG: hypothetical protein ACKVKF_22370 [Rhodobacterales bacterium]|uniref:hypothetical protein n=1 Tax=Puniceibacterium antarcticum TaxID=1206336 RepID=UPI001179DB26|nr:hypothetical protein [Puniceibacterium antarcticum]